MGNDFKKFGPTGKFPRGKLGADDEGELAIGIAADPINQVVRLDFGKSIKWLAIPPSQARELATVLVIKADEAEKKKM